MGNIPRRDILRFSGGMAIGVGVSGCLSISPFEQQLPIGLLIVNHDDVEQSVSVEAKNGSDEELFLEEYAVAADQSYREEKVFNGVQFEVDAHLVEHPRYNDNRSFNFRSCESATIVVTVDNNNIRLGKQDSGC